MKVAWACRLVEHPRAGYWCPRLLQWAETAKEQFPVRWVTTSGSRVTPWAVGLADVTPAQRTALDAVAGVWVIDDIDLAKTVLDLSPTKRTAVKNFFLDLGFTVSNTETFGSLLNRLIATEEVKSLLSLDAELVG